MLFAKRSARVLLILLLPILVACGGEGETSAEGEAGGSHGGPAVPDTALAAAQGAAAADEQGATWQDYQSGMNRAAKEDKYVLIDFWTGWCHWCKVMDRETYSDEAVLRRLERDFVAVKVDAESDAAQGAEAGAPSGRELAREYRVQSYPTACIVGPKGEKLGQVLGYREPEEFLMILDYISSGAYRSQSFEDFQAGRMGG